jgi:ribosomal protein S8
MLFRASLGILNQSIKKKYIFTNIPYCIKSLQLVKLLYKLGYINTYNITNKNINIYFKVYKNDIVINKLYFYSRPGHIKSISYKQLNNLKKNKLYIMLNSLGVCTSTDSLFNKKGGLLLAEIT